MGWPPSYLLGQKIVEAEGRAGNTGYPARIELGRTGFKLYHAGPKRFELKMGSNLVV